jgi:hypothetical protein
MVNNARISATVPSCRPANKPLPTHTWRLAAACATGVYLSQEVGTMHQTAAEDLGTDVLVRLTESKSRSDGIGQAKSQEHSVREVKDSLS